jgi:hypothetical protein
MPTVASFVRAVRIKIDFPPVRQDPDVDCDAVYLALYDDDKDGSSCRRKGKTRYYTGPDLREFDKKYFKEDPQHVNVYYLLYEDKNVTSSANFVTRPDTVVDFISRVTLDFTKNFDKSEPLRSNIRREPVSSPRSSDGAHNKIDAKKNRDTVQGKDLSNVGRADYFHRVFSAFLVPGFLTLLQTRPEEAGEEDSCEDGEEDGSQKFLELDFQMPQGEASSTELFVSYATHALVSEKV